MKTDQVVMLDDGTLILPKAVAEILLRGQWPKCPDDSCPSVVDHFRLKEGILTGWDANGRPIGPSFKLLFIRQQDAFAES